jgi:Uma2 family endonuclease
MILHMNIHSTPPTDPDDFLRWNEGREGKRELVNGQVIEYMINVTRGHVRVVTRLLYELTSKLDPRRFEAYAVDIGLKTPEGVRYPDLVVDVAGGESNDLAVREPVLVCEVLSPSSIVRDTVEKQREYTRIASVQAYLVLSQDEPRGWLWSRAQDGWTGPTMIEGIEAVLKVPALEFETSLASLYPFSRDH